MARRGRRGDRHQRAAHGAVVVPRQRPPTRQGHVRHHVQRADRDSRSSATARSSARSRPDGLTEWHWRDAAADGDLPRVRRGRRLPGRAGRLPRPPLVRRGVDALPARTCRTTHCGCCGTPRRWSSGSSSSSGPTRSTRRAASWCGASAASPWRTRADRRTRSSATARAPRLVVLHELAHQWFGDDVSLGRWRDMWLNEGFATWAEWRYTETHGGISAQSRLLRAYDATGRRHARSGSCTSQHPGARRMFDEPVYVRGAMTLQALRHRIGTTTFMQLMRTWVQEHHGGHGTHVAVRVARRAGQRRGPRAVLRHLAALRVEARQDQGQRAELDRPPPLARSAPICQDGGMSDYRSAHARSIEDPEAYWAEQAELVDWIKKPRRILDDDNAAVLPLVPRRHAEHLLQRPRPARRARPRRPARR